MDNFNFKRFFREFNSVYSQKAMSYLHSAIAKNLITVSDFWSAAQKEISAHKFLSLYFKGKDSNLKVLSHFHLFDPDLLKSVIKETKAFTKPQHEESLNSIYSSDEIFLKELKFWRTAFLEINTELKKHNAFLSRHNFEELLVLLGIFYEKERISKSIERNADTLLIEIINEILNYKFNLCNRQIEGLHTNVTLYEFGINQLGDLLKKGDRDLQSLFDSFSKYMELQYVYDKYCVQTFSMSFFDNATVNLKPTDEAGYLKYRHDGNRYRYWQNYYYNLLAFDLDDIVSEIESSDISWYNKIGEKSTWANFYQFLDAGFPEEVQTTDKTTSSALTIFRIINSLGGWSNIRWNNLIEQRLIEGAGFDPYHIILETMLQNEVQFRNSAMPVLFREFDVLVKQSDEINKTESSRESFLLFTNNLSKPSLTRIDINAKPFIKIGKNIYWIAGILSNKNYSIMLQNILLQSDRVKDEASPTKLFSQNTEEKLVNWFNENNFTTLANHEFIAGRGEIDFLALKDRTLFVGEIKSTFYRTTVREIYMHFNNEETGIKKAVRQLEKDLRYLETNWEDIKSLLKTSLSFSELRVIPLAVSSTLEEGQGKITIAGRKGFIVSAFDLTMILTNRKIYLLNLYEVAMSIKFPNGIPNKYLQVMAGLRNDEQVNDQINKIVIDFISEHAKQLNFNLWAEGNQLCSADDVIQSLEDGSLWSFIQKNEKLSMKNLLVNQITINYFE